MLFYIVKFGIWPWLFNHDDDFGVFIRLGKFEIRWYAICILTGAFLALVRVRKLLKERNMDTDYFDNFFLSVIPISIVGARLWYVISVPDDFDRGDTLSTILSMIGFENGTFALSGLAIQGGVLAGVIWAIYYFHKIKNKYSFGLLCDLAIPNILIGQIIGRIGNFFNGEVYGKLVTRSKLWFVPNFIIKYTTYGTTNTLQEVTKDASVYTPLCFIEGFVNLIGFVLIGVVAYRLYKKIRKPYQIASMYFFYYGLVRFLLEPLRLAKYQMGTSRQMSVIFMVIGLIGYIVPFIIYKDVKYEDIYKNEKYDKIVEEKERLEKEILEKKIQEKKKEILSRKNG